MSILPVKFRMLQMISENRKITNQHLHYMLKKEYPYDRYVSEQGVDECLLSLKQGGLIEVTESSISEYGKLVQCYQITAYGTGRMKYIDQ